MADLREALTAAYEQEEENEQERMAKTGASLETVQSEPDVSEGEGTTGEEGTGEELAGTGTEAESQGDQADTETEQAAEPEKKETEDKTLFLPPEGEQESEESKALTPEELDRIPVSWKAGAKQHWNQLPAEVRSEVIRRERETDRVLRDSSDARKFQDSFQEVVKPFEHLMAAEGVPPLQATQNLMRTAAGLQTGTPQQKAALVAKIIRTYGVDVIALDDMLAPGEGQEAGGNGAQPPGGDQRVYEYIDQKLAPVNQLLSGVNEARQKQQQETDASIEEELNAFEADPQNVFYADVQEDMADLIEMAARRKRSMSLKEAYDLAVNARPDLVELQQKTQLQPKPNGGLKKETLKRKRMAAASVSGVSTETAPPAPSTLRDSLSQAWDIHGGES